MEKPRKAIWKRKNQQRWHVDSSVDLPGNSCAKNCGYEQADFLTRKKTGSFPQFNSEIVNEKKENQQTIVFEKRRTVRLWKTLEALENTGFCQQFSCDGKENFAQMRQRVYAGFVLSR